MKIEVPHELTPSEAMVRMEDLVAYWRQKYGVESRWASRVAQLAGSVFGVSFEATLEVGERTVRVEAPDPGFLVRHQIAAYLTRKLLVSLAPRDALRL